MTDETKDNIAENFFKFLNQFGYPAALLVLVLYANWLWVQGDRELVKEDRAYSRNVVTKTLEVTTEAVRGLAVAMAGVREAIEESTATRKQTIAVMKNLELELHESTESRRELLALLKATNTRTASP